MWLMLWNITTALLLRVEKDAFAPRATVTALLDVVVRLYDDVTEIGVLEVAPHAAGHLALVDEEEYLKHNRS